MPNYNISLNDDLAQIVETEIKEGKYSNRSEFFRALVRNRYVADDDRCTIETVSVDDSDAAIIKQRKHDASFVPLKRLLRA